MFTKRFFSLALSTALFFSLNQTFSYSSVQALENNPAKKITRLQGDNRFKTSIAIADDTIDSNELLDNVVLTSGYNFPDGLSGGIFAKKLNAPLLMAGNLSDSQDALDFIYNHLKQNGNVYILGGTNAVGQDTQDKLNDKGYNVSRIDGKDRIETNNNIVSNLNVKEGTPVFIANAYGFADALSASSISSIDGYPILLSGNDNLPQLIIDQLSKIKPSSVYIVGGTGVISTNVENIIKNYLPSTNIVRLSGTNRFETSIDVFNYFNLSTTNIILSSGKDFPDALCGSQLAVKLNAFLVLADENNLTEQQKDYNKKGIKNFYILGGTGALNNNVENVISSTPDDNDNPDPSPTTVPTPSCSPSITPTAYPKPSVTPTPSSKPSVTPSPRPSVTPTPGPEFDTAVEESKIENIYVEQDNAIRNKDIANFMAYIDENSPIYTQTEALFSQYVNQSLVSIDGVSDSFEFNFSDDYTAVVTSLEHETITNLLFDTTSNKTKTVTTTFKKINGKWMIYDSNLLK